jgi:outer membrane lipoprotein-sorting protein
MRSNDSLKSMLRELRYQATPGQRQRTLENIFHVMDEAQEPTPAWGRPGIGRRTMNPRITRLALAAAVILIVLGGISFWPFSSRPNQWWLGSPAAWGQEITRSLEKVNALIYREGYVHVGDYGSTHISGNWSRWYKAADRQRKDTYYDDALVSTMWEIPDGSGSTVHCDVSYEFQCFTTETHTASRPTSDPVSILRFYVNLLGKADRVLDANSFEGKDCVGFEISAAKYGNNPKEWTDRIWFAKETGLPVRIEYHGRPVTNHPEETSTLIQDEFQYASEVPADIFEPRIPEGFVNAHPDTIRKAREREEKGEMTFATVPAGLKDRLFAAFRQAQTVAYTEAGTRFYVSRNAWRADRLDGDRIRQTEWHIIQKDDNAPTSLDFNDKNYRQVQTTVDYDAHTWRQIEQRQSPWMSHPLDRLGFTIGLVDRADRFYESVEIDGVACFGFDVSAKKYGTNPDGAFHRVWFDTATNLPVRMETHWPDSDGTGVTVMVQEQFDWDPVLPADFFTAQVPPGFTLVEE